MSGYKLEEVFKLSGVPVQPLPPLCVRSPDQYSCHNDTPTPRIESRVFQQVARGSKPARLACRPERD
jgi:hypothetical protein